MRRVCTTHLQPSPGIAPHTTHHTLAWPKGSSNITSLSITLTWRADTPSHIMFAMVWPRERRTRVLVARPKPGEGGSCASYLIVHRVERVVLGGRPRHLHSPGLVSELNDDVRI